MAKKSGAHQRDWKWPGDGVPKSVSSRADLGELPLKGETKQLVAFCFQSFDPYTTVLGLTVPSGLGRVAQEPGILSLWLLSLFNLGAQR